MTASEYLKARLAQLNGAEFTKNEVNYPCEEFTSYKLDNALKTLIRSKEVVKIGMVGLQTGKYKLISEVKEKPKKLCETPWSAVWPEFFRAPDIYGRCRTYMPRD